MFINLNTITKEGIILDQEIIFDESFYKNTLIKGLKNTFVKGKIYYSTTREVIFDGVINGVMVIQDSNTAELVDYSFEREIDEILAEDENLDENLRTNDKNSLDLMDILWQNIVLEVPLQYSKLKEPALKKGVGWELVDENIKKQDPRLEPLKALLGEERE